MDRCLEAAGVSDSRPSRRPRARERARFAAEAAASAHVAHSSSPGAESAASKCSRARSPATRRPAAARRVPPGRPWRGDFRASCSSDEIQRRRTQRSRGRGLWPRAGGDGHLEKRARSCGPRRSAEPSRRDPSQLPLVLRELAQLDTEEPAGTRRSATPRRPELAVELGQGTRHDEAGAVLARLAIGATTGRAHGCLEHSRPATFRRGLWPTCRLAAAVDGDSRALDILRGAWELASRSGRTRDLTHYGPPLVHPELAVGDRARAAEAARQVAAIAAATGVEPMARTAARCAALVPAMPRAAEVAAAAQSEDGHLDELAAVNEEAAAALVASGRNEEAIAHLREALHYAERVGAVRDRRRIEAALRLARRPSWATRPASSARVGLGEPDRHGAARRRAGSQGIDELAHRRSAVHLRTNRGAPPDAYIRQARYRLARDWPPWLRWPLLAAELGARTLAADAERLRGYPDVYASSVAKHCWR